MKQKKKLTILLTVFAALVIAYTGISRYQAYQDKQEAKKASSEKIILKKTKAITSITYHNDGELTFVKEKGTWLYQKNKDYPLIQDTLDTMANSFRNIEAVRQLRNGDSLASYGLDQPSQTLQVADSSGTKTTYYVGNAVGENYYMTLDDKSKVYTVSASVIENLSYTLDSLIQTDTFPTISSGNLTKVVITENQKTKTYNSKDTEDLDAIAGGLGTFTFGDCQNYAVKSSELSDYGLDEDARTTLTVTYKDTSTKKKATLTLYIGKKDASKKNYYIKLSNSDIVYLGDIDVVDNMLNK